MCGGCNVLDQVSNRCKAEIDAVLAVGRFLMVESAIASSCAFGCVPVGIEICLGGLEGFFAL